MRGYVTLHKTASLVAQFLSLHSDYQWRANVLRRTGIEGEKKYSPPFGTTHSAVSESSAPWLFGSVPESVRMVWLDVCPMMGSKPGTTGSFRIGKPVLFAQPVVLVRDCPRRATDFATYFAG